MNLFQQLAFFVFSVLYVLGQVQKTRFIPPPPHAGISSIYLKNQSMFYFHSGMQTENTFLEGIQQIYDYTEGSTWRFRPSLSLDYPDSRSFYASFLYENRYYIFGGIGAEAIFRDLWFYDIVYDQWTQIYVPNPIPRRYSFAHTTFTFGNKFYFAVAGGKSESYYDNLLDFYL